MAHIVDSYPRAGQVRASEHARPGEGGLVGSPTSGQALEGAQGRSQHDAWRWLLGGLVTVDALLLGVAFGLAAVLRQVIPVFLQGVSIDLYRYGLMAVVSVPGLLGVFWLRGAYSRRHLLGGPEEYARVASGCTYGLVLAIAATFIQNPQGLISRGWLLLFWSLSIALVCIGRFAVRRVAYGLRGYGWFVHRVLVAGVSDQGLAIAQRLDGRRSAGIEVVGLLDDYLPLGTQLPRWAGTDEGQPEAPFPVLGHPSEAERLAREQNVDLLVVVPSGLSWESQRALSQLGERSDRGLEVRQALTQQDLSAASVVPAPIGGVPLLRVDTLRLNGPSAFAKSVLDRGSALVLLLLLSPALVLALLRTHMRGITPTFEREQVYGRGGEMVTLTLLNPEVTTNVLVRGIPALVAVIRGSLALAGPKPIRVGEEAAYRPWLTLLLGVSPGLTGPWRLGRNVASAEDQVLADAWWVRNWSVWQHVFVLFKTVQFALGGASSGHHVRRWQPGRTTPGLTLMSRGAGAAPRQAR